MRTWPAVEVRVGSDPELLHAALSDFEVSAIEENAPDRWRVFFHTTDERDRAARALTAYASTPLEVPDEDWAARSQASLHAVQVGRLVVAPPWDLVIRIQPSMGFGTGHHATTRLCLGALQQIDVRGRSVLDVGTGSGVLAIAASLLGASPVIALDDDPDAVQAACENVELNPGAQVDVRVEDLRTFRGPHGAAPPPFDVVLANLTGGLLIQTATRLRDLTAPGGHLILSGFMEHESRDVLARFSNGLRESFKEEEWACVVLQVPRD